MSEAVLWHSHSLDSYKFIHQAWIDTYPIPPLVSIVFVAKRLQVSGGNRKAYILA